MKNLQSGDWILSEDGVAQVISLSDVYIEEFNLCYRSGRCGLGEFIHTLVSYKVLCDFEGVPRKRNRATFASLSEVDVASAETLEIVSGIRNKHEEYFLDFLRYKSSVRLKNSYNAWLNVPEDEAHELAAYVNSCDLEMPFTYPELMELVFGRFPSFDSDSIHLGEFSRTDNNLLLVLFNDDLKRSGKRAVFASVNAIVR